MSKLMTAEEAVKLIKDGDAIGIGGFIGMGHPRTSKKSDYLIHRCLPENRMDHKRISLDFRTVLYLS